MKTNGGSINNALAFVNSHRSLYAQTLRRGVYLWSGFWSLSPRYLQEQPADPLNMVFCTGLTILTLIGLRRAWLVNRAIATPYMSWVAEWKQELSILPSKVAVAIGE